jgi:hypothetical protein
MSCELPTPVEFGAQRAGGLPEGVVTGWCERHDPGQELCYRKVGMEMPASRGVRRETVGEERGRARVTN